MSSDLPQAGYAGAHEMARSLVTYIACPKRVQREVKAEFRFAPAIATIEKMRETHLAPPHGSPREYYHEPYDPYAKIGCPEKVNREFLWRLDQERLASARRASARQSSKASQAAAAPKATQA